MIPIAVDNITFAYPGGIQALHGVSFRIAPGERIALIGQNGAGKTTLAQHLNGLLRPATGSVLVGDRDTRMHTTAQLARHVGYVFQHPSQQIFKRSVRAEVAFGPRAIGMQGEVADASVRAALAVTNLTVLADRHPHDLLPAQRKLVAIASVLAMNTSVVIFDEPTTGQDAHGIRMIGAILEQLAHEGRTTIVISHDMDFCADYCARFVVLNEGRVLIDGAPEIVFQRHDLLEQSAVEPPQIARLADRLALPLTWQIDRLLDALEAKRPKQ